MTNRNYCLALPLLLLMSANAQAQEIMNSAMVWFCEDSQMAHGTCSTVWSGMPSSGFFNETRLDFECELMRGSVIKADETWLLEELTSSGTQLSSLLETELFGFSANYCTRNLSEITAGARKYRDSTQFCRPYSSSKILP
ncbi:MAG: hypothetical protein AAFN78_18670 [Pseudomonadota bacterium]